MTQLCRDKIKPLLADLSKLKAGYAHPGLPLTKGLVEFPEGSKVGEIKAKRIREICEINHSIIYAEAYQRWKAATRDFAHTEAALVGRLYIGVTRDNALAPGVSAALARFFQQLQPLPPHPQEATPRPQAAPPPRGTAIITPSLFLYFSRSGASFMAASYRLRKNMIRMFMFTVLKQTI